MKELIFGLSFFLVTFSLRAQVKYFVYFTDKEGVEFDPYQYFDQKAIDRRQREGIRIDDISDYPVREDYTKAVNALCDSSQMTSRWLNGMSIYATQDQIDQIKLLPFVKEIERLQLLSADALALKNDSADVFDLSSDQLDQIRFQKYRHKAASFSEQQLNGSGIRIAIFDVGFPNVDTHPAFKYIREHHHIIATYDFIKKNENVYYSMSHGTSVLSCIAGWYDTISIGMAPDAEFLLAKTELRNSEFSSEEDNWLAAAEWADKNGADIISSSLGYGKERYYQKEMNGRKSLVSRAAKIASDKGILVVNAAGNEADNIWETIVTPGDVEEVLTIGGTDPGTDLHIEFSSFGPTADGRMKPNVCSLGDVVCATKNGFGGMQGTSFATPLMSGFAACAWQSNREFTRAELFEAIEKSGHLYPYYDYAHGYGIPQATYFTSDQNDIADTTFTMTILGDIVEIQFRKDQITELSKPKNFYYECIDEHGSIGYFAVMIPELVEIENEMSAIIEIPVDIMESDISYSIRAHFEGYTNSIPLKPK